jgi:hypothetical protein
VVWWDGGGGGVIPKMHDKRAISLGVHNRPKKSSKSLKGDQVFFLLEFMSFFLIDRKKIITQVGSHEHPVSFQELGAEKFGFIKQIMKSLY